MKSEVIIRELAGQKRSVRLRGAGLPRQGGAAWGGNLRAVTTWYPGNSANATQQVMGPTEKQTTFSGVWNTTRLNRAPCIFEPTVGNMQNVTFADSLREIIEDIIRKGTLLNVMWINAEAATFGGRGIQRIGRCVDWNFTYQRMDDLEWTLTFDWTGRGLGQQRVTQFRTDGTTSSSAAQIQALGTTVDDAVNKTKIQLSKRTVPKSATKFTLEQLGQIADAPSKLMRDFSQSMNRISNRVSALSELINKTKGQQYELANQFLDATTTAVQSARKFYDSLTQKPAELLETQQKLASLTRAASYFKGGADTANIVQQQAYPIAAQIRAEIDARRASGPNGIAPPPGGNAPANQNGTRSQVQVHLVKQGETLLSISLLFYGVIEGAYGIAFSNGLSLKALPPVGKVLIIPPLNAGPTPQPTLPVPPAGGQVTLPGGVGKLPGSP